MNDDFIAELGDAVKEKLDAHLRSQSLLDVASLTWICGQAQEMARWLCELVLEAWRKELVRLGEAIGRLCPRCGQPRKWKWRANDPMKIEVLGFRFVLPKPYLECGHCDAPGLSIMKLLTGLKSGDASIQLKLMAAYSAAKETYGKSTQTLQAHHGQKVERTKIRRMALQIEEDAARYAETERQQVLGMLTRENQGPGVLSLMLEADGGKVRVGKLLPCEKGDRGYGKKTAKRGIPKRKRPTSYREIITMDMRPPGTTEPSALDAMVPALSKEGERSRRMLAIGVRSGLGHNTRVRGLGDMGSGLAASFEEAFVGYSASWSADWKHTSDYVENASKVLCKLDVDAWCKKMKSSIWARNVSRRNALLAEAKAHRVKKLPAQYEKCPVHALTTYLQNNWKHMLFAERKKEGLPIVSARAESQVRDRTKGRFSVAGAWSEENLEGKAILRAIIADGRWESFKSHEIADSQSAFEVGLLNRIEQALAEGRVDPKQVSELVGEREQQQTRHGQQASGTQRTCEDRWRPERSARPSSEIGERAVREMPCQAFFAASPRGSSCPR